MLNRQEILIRDLAAQYKKDPRIIESIVYSPLKFTKKVINDPTEERPVRIRYLGAFVQKATRSKDTRFTKMVGDLENDIVSTAVVMATILHFPMKDVESARNIINLAKETKDYEKVRLIWDTLKEYKK